MGIPRRVLIAPDSFKGTATAAEVAAALAAGWAGVRPDDELVLLPMADGGEGTLDAFAAAVGDAEWVPVTVPGPDSRPVDTGWLRLPDGTGVVELAATSGLTLLAEPAPFDAHTRGLGTAIAAALDAGVERLLLPLGGSASTDGGLGVLTALGARFLDAAGDPVPDGGRGAGVLATADLSGLRPLPPGGAVVLGDVTAPLCGPHGAAAVFGPQKGASPADVDVLDADLARLGRLLADATGADPAAAGAGAAGGTGFGLLAWGATIDAGSAAVGRALGLPAAVAAADVVVTGEGRYDAQSATGKVPAHVAELAAAAGVPVLLVAGRIDAATDPFAAVSALGEVAGSDAAAMADAVTHLRSAGGVLARARHRA